MKKSLITYLTASLLLTACASPTSQDLPVTENTDSETSENNLQPQPEEPQSQEQSTSGQMIITEEIPEVGIKVSYPDPYNLIQGGMQGLRGAFADYIWSNPWRSMPGNESYNSPDFSQIWFYSRKSIQEFLDECGNPCVTEGPTVELYDAQKKILTEKNSTTQTEMIDINGENYELLTFNQRNYLVRFYRFGDGSMVREYTAFIGDTKIDIWVTLVRDITTETADDIDSETADALFNQFSIIE